MLIQTKFSLRDKLQEEKQSDKEVEAEQSSQGETDSGSEGSEYDRHDYENELKQGKRKRKTTFKRAAKRPTCYKRVQKKRTNDLSGAILPQSGDKSVAREAFAKLDSAQQGIVREKVNKKTKQVLPFIVELRSMFDNLFLFRSRSNLFVRSSLTLDIMTW